MCRAMHSAKSVECLEGREKNLECDSFYDWPPSTHGVRNVLLHR